MRAAARSMCRRLTKTRKVHMAQRRWTQWAVGAWLVVTSGVAGHAHAGEAARHRGTAPMPQLSPVLQSAALPSTWQRVVDAATLGVLMDHRLGAARRHCASCLRHVADAAQPDALQRAWAAEGMSVARLSTVQLGDAGLLRVTNLRPLSLQLSAGF